MISLLARLRALVFSALRLRTLGAFVLAVDAEGRILLIRNSYGSRAWSLPGGGVKRYETARAAALREAREEVGLVTHQDSSSELLGLYLKRRGRWSDHVAVFVLRGWTLHPVENWEVSEHRLFDPDDLPADTAPAVRKRIDEWKGRSPTADAW